ncbi:MAG: curli assembly protein CsgF [Halarsenatibacteraceae bacterium]
MKKVLPILLIFGLIFTFVATVEAYNGHNYTMSWSFQTFNNPNARQVAINTAEKQDGLIEVDDPIQNFADGLERRLYSSAQREIVNKIMDEDEVPYGQYEAGNLNISVAEDPQTGEVIVEIVDKISGDSTVITYSGDSFGSGFNW